VSPMFPVCSVTYVPGLYPHDEAGAALLRSAGRAGCTSAAWPASRRPRTSRAANRGANVAASAPLVLRHALAAQRSVNTLGRRLLVPRGKLAVLSALTPPTIIPAIAKRARFRLF